MSANATKRAKKKRQSKQSGAKRNGTVQKLKPDGRGLCVNTEFFRSLTQRAPQTIIHDARPEEDENYYLKLADISLGLPNPRADQQTESPKSSPAPRKTKAG